MLLHGQGVARDNRAAFGMLNSAAEKGHLKSAALVGNMLASGTGTAVDYAAAVRWLTQAAEGDVTQAQHDLGALYSHGHGVPRDFGQAARWLTPAAEKGFVPSQAALGNLYRLADLPDKSKPVYWLKKAADAGSAEAKNYLGEMYWNGQGVPKDLNKAFALIQQAAKAGLPIAQYHAAPAPVHRGTRCRSPQRRGSRPLGESGD